MESDPIFHHISPISLTTDVMPHTSLFFGLIADGTGSCGTLYSENGTEF